jgi:cytoskeletal protein CcmA (bactofilin family)
MFGRKTPVHNPTDASEGASFDTLNHVGKGTTIDGGMESSSSLRIDGKIKGTVSVKERLILGPTGIIEGKVICKDADIAGTVRGDIESSGLMRMLSTANLNGDIKVTQLSIEPGAVFNGNCTTSRGSLGEFLNDGQQKPKEIKA